MGSVKKEAESQSSFECDFCQLSLHSKSQRKLHTINEHFEKKRCLDCYKTLIRIDDDWYELHTAANCSREDILFGSNDNHNIIIVDQLIKKEEENEEMVVNESDSMNPNLSEVKQSVSNEFPKFKNKNVTEGERKCDEFVSSNLPISQKEIERRQLLSVTNKSKKNHTENKSNWSRKKSLPSKVIKHRNTALFRTAEKELVCNICNKTFTSNRSMSNHMRIHEYPSETKINCSICKRSCKNLISLRNHMRAHSNKRDNHRACCQNQICPINLRPHGELTCDICKKKLKDINSIRSHMRRYHVLETWKCKPKMYTCDICSKVLPGYEKIVSHMSKHSKVVLFTCNYCGRGFYSRPNLIEHENRHTGARIYTCAVCGKEFRNGGNLKHHSYIHTGEKPYRCTIEGCDRAYAASTDLRRHKYGAHRIYTKKHICPICSKVYPENKLLRKHLETHA